MSSMKNYIVSINEVKFTVAGDFKYITVSLSKVR